MKGLAELEDAIESGELVRLPCKVGDTVYGVGMFDCLLNHTDGVIKSKISSFCDEIHGDCWRCQYAYPQIREFVCTDIQIEGDGVYVEGYRTDEIFTDKAQAEARLKELEEKK